VNAEVVFGGALIFHGFASTDDAERFADFVIREYLRPCLLPLRASDVNEWCLYPFELDGPTVLVKRDHQWTLEDEIEAAVARFGGRFAGT